MDQQAAEPIVPVVGIGSSAGGLEALREMFSGAEVPTGLAFVVIQHLDPHHESMLAELIGRHTKLAVRQCQGGEVVEPDTVFIIPPGHGLSIENGRLELTSFAQPRGLRRPIDDFFISLANDQHANAACVILSGTGADGTTGLRAIKENGGLCVVQEPSSAKYDGMPLSATGTGLVDFIKPSDQILGCINAFFFRRTKSADRKAASFVSDHIDDICRALRTNIGHDFSGYKRTTFLRRVERRMHVLGIDKGSSYLTRVQEDPAECDALFRDLLINVTRFFRDASFFETLREQAIRPLLKRGAGSEEGVRVWIPGCSSGEEAYSIAMIFAEEARDLNLPCNAQLFATDIDESMLQIARHGSYPAAALADIPVDLHERYVVPQKDRFHFVTSIRDMIRFSGHSLVKDPPFSRIDLVSCRNLLIYFDEKLQKTVMPLFHYALKPGGFLFLGPSESVGRFDNVFAEVDQRARLFKRLPGSPTYPIALPGAQKPVAPRPSAHDHAQNRSHDMGDIASNRLIERYAPPSIVLDSEGHMVSAFGRVSRFFEFPVSRTADESASSLARPGVREQLGPLTRQAQVAGRRVVARNVEVITEFGSLRTEIICDPLDDGTYLLVFHDNGDFKPMQDSDLIELEPSNGHIEALERELRSAKHRLRSATEELETANEELKSSNEEMMSMNEELQSTNEELTTVNDELKNKIEQLTVANSDLRNFFDSTDLAVIVLDREMRVRSFTRAATEIFPLQATDRGRPLPDVASRLKALDYVSRCQMVMSQGTEYRDTVMDPEKNRTFTLRILPYRASDGAIDGATVVMTDISHALDVETQLAAERDRHELAIKAAGIGVWEYLPEEERFILGGSAVELLQAADDQPPLEAVLGKLEENDRIILREALTNIPSDREGFELTTRIDTGDASRWVKTFGRYMLDRDPGSVIGVSVDVTPEHELAEARELMLREMNHRVKNLFAMIGGILRMAARSHQTAKDLVEDVEGRVLALGSAHSLASSQRRETAVPLQDLVEIIVAPFRQQSHIEIQPEEILIDPKFITPLTLVLHEWATNGLKHGVLGRESGQLLVSWKKSAEKITLEWNEIGTEAVKPANAAGFGTVLLSSAARQMGGEIETEINQAQLKHTLKLPVMIEHEP